MKNIYIYVQWVSFKDYCVPLRESFRECFSDFTEGKFTGSLLREFNSETAL